MFVRIVFYIDPSLQTLSGKSTNNSEDLQAPLMFLLYSLNDYLQFHAVFKIVTIFSTPKT